MENDPEKLAGAVRSHWGRENSLHWVLDIAFREDENRIRKDHAPVNMAVLRQIALNLLKKENSKRRSLKTNRLGAGWDNQYLASGVMANSKCGYPVYIPVFFVFFDTLW